MTNGHHARWYSSDGHQWYHGVTAQLCAFVCLAAFQESCWLHFPSFLMCQFVFWVDSKYFPCVLQSFWRVMEIFLYSQSLSIHSPPLFCYHIQSCLGRTHQQNQKLPPMLQTLCLRADSPKPQPLFPFTALWEERSWTSITERLFQGTYLEYKWII